MSADLYPRPSREAIAARFETPEPPRVVQGIVEREPTPISHYCDSGNCEVCGDGTGDEPQQEETPGPLANFATHLAARMRALGWDQAQLQERAGISAHVAAKAINGTGCDIGVGERIAAAVGGYLATMIGPYMCVTCAGEPPKGFACLECGTEARAA